MQQIIKGLRKEKNLTQAQLAEILELDQTAISKWELGKAVPDTATLIKLSRYFDVSTDYLLGLSSLYYPDRISTKNNSPTDNLSAEEKKILEDFKRLPRAERAQASEYVHYLATRYDREEKNFS